MPESGKDNYKYRYTADSDQFSKDSGEGRIMRVRAVTLATKLMLPIKIEIVLL